MDDAEAFVSGNAKLAKKELMLIFMLTLIPKTFFKMHYKKCHNKRRTSKRHKMHWSEGIRLQTVAITNIGEVTLAVLSKTNLYEILRTCYFFAKHP